MGGTEDEVNGEHFIEFAFPACRLFDDEIPSVALSLLCHKVLAWFEATGVDESADFATETCFDIAGKRGFDEFVNMH